MLARERNTELLNSICNNAKAQAAIDTSPAPFFDGALNTPEEKLYIWAYNQEFARRVELEAYPHIQQ